MKNDSVEESQLVWNLAKIATGGGIIGAIWYLSPIPLMDLVMFFLLTIAPVLGVLVGLNIISSATFSLIWNNELKARVEAAKAKMMAKETEVLQELAKINAHTKPVAEVKAKPVVATAQQKPKPAQVKAPVAQTEAKAEEPPVIRQRRRRADPTEAPTVAQA